MDFVKKIKKRLFFSIVTLGNQKFILYWTSC